jgi:hypothetical protein
MILSPALRKFALTTHVMSSVGWLGAVVSFLALAITATTTQDVHTVRASYLAMNLTGWYVIIPLCIASFLTGLVMALGTSWGVFRHYWVLIKLMLTSVSALILFGFTQTLNALGELAADTTLPLDELQKLGQSPVLHSGAGLLALLAATVLSVYKPRGMTPYGWRKQYEQRAVRQSADVQT